LAQTWRVLSHPLLLGILLILAASAFIAHLWLPQLPTALAADPAASSAWLDEIASGMFGGKALRALGAFNLAHNPALRLILPMLAATLFIHLINGAIRALNVRKLTPPDVWLPGLHAWDASLPGPVEDEDWDRACTSLCKSGRTLSEPWEEEGEQRLCDCHARWQWLTMLTQIGLLLALAALMLNLFSGWQVDGLTLDPGASASLAPYADLTVGFSDDASQITLCCPEESAPLSRGRIMRGGVQVQVTHQNSALRIALEQEGKPLNLQAIEQGAQAATDLIVHFPEARSERAIAAPEANLFFRLAALDDGGFRVQALDAANQVLLSQEIHEETTLTVGDGLTLHLTPTTFIILRAQGRPWTWLLWPALVLILAGLFVRWRYPYWRIGALQNEAGAALRWQGPKSTRQRFAAFIDLVSGPTQPPTEETT